MISMKSMTSIKIIFSSFCLIFLTANLCFGKEWRGIIPLHSTRADVERLIGLPTSPGGSEYSLKDEHVVILYSGRPCEKDKRDGLNVAPDTVLTITVSPRKEQTISNLNLDL